MPHLNGTARIAVALSACWIAVLCAVAVWPALFPKLSNLFILDFQTLDTPPKLEPQLLWRPLTAVVLVPLLLMTALVFSLQWIHRGFAGPGGARYVREHRLQDVIVLIQILALHQYSHRSEDGLKADAKGNPISAESWLMLAKEHPEFFRVDATANHAASLVARHVLSDNATEVDRTKLAGDLIRVAVDLHDRQERNAQRWQAFVPIFSAVLAAAIALASLTLRQQ